MSTSSSSPAGPASSVPGASAWQPRRAWRDLRQPELGGVAGGLAVHLSVPVLWVRLAFVVGALLGGAGLAAYGALWVLLPAGPPPELVAPGLASAERTGRRAPRLRALADRGPTVVLAVLGVGLALTASGILGAGWWIWPVGIAVAGVALLWRQADEAQRERWRDAGERLDPSRLVLGGGWEAWARLAAGVTLVVVALSLVVLRDGTLTAAREAVVPVVLAVVGLAIVLGPFAIGLVGELARERSERVRTQERADVAAHLHDSVLQTLALIQREPADAVRLARTQERELRAWLYAGESLDDTTLASALRAAAGEVDDTYGIGVDVVTVGDRASDELSRSLVMAAREAMVNAAKHAGVDRIDVYAEIAADRVEVFVRDRGAGFDVEAVLATPDDRLGVRASIIERMRRHGGSATIRSTPGSGTEVRLVLGEAER
ncbi:PspC domain-containing protein [Nocardioides sp.]|uniref:PspC domain-containing protein n=1 Tax=Nocardioides sp. TaxID=35761 RepID=UPI00351777D2